MSQGERYTRHLLQWGEERLERLRRSSVLVAGVGGLGCGMVQILVRAGVGRLHLVDSGVVDWPDLNRQVLYGEGDLGRKKLDVARERLAVIHSGVDLVTWDCRIDAGFRVPEGLDLVVDCLDNYQSRIDLYNVTPEKMLYVHGGVQGVAGQVLTLRKGESQPLAKIFAGCRQPQGPIPVTPDSVAVIAGLQASEVLHALWEMPKLLNRFLIFDLTDFHASYLPV